MRENPDDETLFGTSDMQELVRDPFQFEEYGQSAHMVFNDAARFNAEFASEQDLQHALAAIKAAAEIEGAGNPFSNDYLVFSSDDDVQHSDRLDQSTKATYGSLTFWAFAPQAARKTEEEEEAEKATGNDGGDEAA
jgi:hypothetical protein